MFNIIMTAMENWDISSRGNEAVVGFGYFVNIFIEKLTDKKSREWWRQYLKYSEFFIASVTYELM